MKRIATIIAGIIAFAGIASADNDRIITYDQLPAKAREFISQNFANEKVSYTKQERDFMEVTYEVVFVKGTKIEFGSKGDWKEIDCKYSTLDRNLVPVKIREYVESNYPDTEFVKIERSRRDYEVKLTNRLELTFDLNFNLIDIDD